MHDNEVIKKVLEGDTGAFEHLVKKYQKLLLYSVYNIVHNQALTEDIVQEAFVKAFMKLDTLREPDGFFAWIKKIATNIAFNALAKNRNMLTVDNDPENYDFIENFPTNLTPEDYTLNEEMKYFVQEFVNELPEKLRLVLLMREIEGMDYEQISQALNIPVGTVRSRLFNARQILKDRIVKRGLADGRR